MEQNVDVPIPRGGLHVLPDPGGSSSSAVSRDERGGRFFFRTFLESKKVQSPPLVRIRGCPPGRAHGLRRLCGGSSTTSTSSTTAPCLSRLGTISTIVTVGAKSVVKRSSSSASVTWSRPGTLSVPCELGAVGYKFMALWTVCEMVCFFVTLDGNVPVAMHCKFQQSFR